jgi:hypothetical protein
VTLSAWIMLAATWSVVIFFTLRFFLRVLASGTEASGDDVERP